ncbi:pimeloyl-ACP methyl ester esterase BioH [Methylocucumis oryzae]|uniref:Pimeloyl-[acyl-carrier protein] methyl ester esterase n=1 Tax=Methylocucumis oryzae TaxID=1632867 RepID=A0A0F3IL79_9GAMM|nr:pimeloyl-ACP methyl ester esterase BioH [Methylocucumis oryzae]KJV06314.1 carboxylesterase [Methylocucumis oryzae]
MTQLHIECLGAGEPLVMLHGWSMHSAIWYEFAQELAKSYQVYLVDLPGHGLSDTVIPYSLASVGDAIIAALPNQPSYWLGWSLGATLALSIAERHPERVKRLVLIAGNPCFVKRADWPGMRAEVLQQFAEQLLQDAPATLLRFLSLQVQGMAAYKPVLKQLRSALSKRSAPNNATLQAGLALLTDTDLRPALTKLAQPVMALLGAKDALVPKALAPALAELNPQIRVNCLAGSAHAPFLSDSAECLALIHDFFQ